MNAAQVPGADGPGAGPVDSDNAQIAAAAEPTLLDGLRARREQLLRDDHFLTLEIPGYNGELAARYKTVPYSEINEVSRRLRKESDDRQEVIGSIDTLIKCCDQIMVKVNGQFVPIDKDAVPPIRFDARLARLFGFETEKARDVVRGIFNNDFAIVRQNISLSTWLQDVTADVDEALVGE